MDPQFKDLLVDLFGLEVYEILIRDHAKNVKQLMSLTMEDLLYIEIQCKIDHQKIVQFRSIMKAYNTFLRTDEIIDKIANDASSCFAYLMMRTDLQERCGEKFVSILDKTYQKRTKDPNQLVILGLAEETNRDLSVEIAKLF